MASEATLINHHQEQLRRHPKQQSLKCPRCDSSNTKFCYYNNYSLSQPRHFCKACKRYWTRGGSLRNVPVGGGCRKTKKVKVTTTLTSTNHVASALQPVTSHVGWKENKNLLISCLETSPTRRVLGCTKSKTVMVGDPKQTISCTVGRIVTQPVDQKSNPNPNPNFDQLSLFYGLVPQNHNYQRFNSTIVSSGYDFSQPQMRNLGLGFSYSDHVAGVMAKPSQNSISFLSNCPSSMFVASNSSAPTMSSIQRLVGWSKDQFEGRNYDDELLEAMTSSSDPNSLLWNMSNGSDGGWFDPTTNIYSSVPSLI